MCIRDSEITALAKMLTKMGAKIEGIGTTELIIEGVDELKPVNEETIPDRIEAATYLIAAAMTMGEIQLENVNPYHLTSVISKLEEAGCEIDINSNKIYLKADAPPKPVDLVTAVYPGIPTDIQAQWTSYMMTAEGTSKVTDNIYQDRFKHIPELVRLGAKIDIVDNAAIISGGEKLSGATVMSSDLRGSASLILAALVAKGATEVLRIYHLDRGYDNIEQKLKKLGAVIERHQTELV